MATKIVGGMTITPPLIAAELRDSIYQPGNNHAVVLGINQTVEDLDVGTLYRLTADQIYPGSGSYFTAGHNLEAEVNDLIGTFGATHMFNGTFNVAGENRGEIWRLTITDNLVVREDATATWPDGSPVTT